MTTKLPNNSIYVEYKSLFVGGVLHDSVANELFGMDLSAFGEDTFVRGLSYKQKRETGAYELELDVCTFDGEPIETLTLDALRAHIETHFKALKILVSCHEISGLVFVKPAHVLSHTRSACVH